MESKYIMEQLVWKIQEYAKGRASDVARGAETPKLAALLLQKYGYGIADAVYVLFDNGMDIDKSDIYNVVDKEVAKIDPNWRENAKKRWEGRPADVVNLSEE